VTQFCSVCRRPSCGRNGVPCYPSARLEESMLHLSTQLALLFEQTKHAVRGFEELQRALEKIEEHFKLISEEI